MTNGVFSWVFVFICKYIELDQQKLNHVIQLIKSKFAHSEPFFVWGLPRPANHMDCSESDYTILYLIYRWFTVLLGYQYPDYKSFPLLFFLEGVAASSLFTSGKYAMDPELRGLEYERITQNLDVHFWKTFWNITESEVLSVSINVYYISPHAPFRQCLVNKYLF